MMYNENEDNIHVGSAVKTVSGNMTPAKKCASDGGYRTFDAMSESTWNLRMYDDIVQTLLMRCAALAGKKALDLSLSSVLDVGCGPGGMSIALIKQTPIFEICLLDLREEALKKASQRIKDITPETNITIHNADVHDIPIEDNVFDLVISRGSQRFWKDQIRAFEEIRRVMKPHAIAYVGGGRGSQIFQKKRADGDDSWEPRHFACDSHDRRRLPSFKLPDRAFRQLFETWGDRYVIYSQKGDGHWYCWQKND